MTCVCDALSVFFATEVGSGRLAPIHIKSLIPAMRQLLNCCELAVLVDQMLHKSHKRCVAHALK
jgi:hypothetical protein